ncbi:hypothetical protein B0H17DRAFT_1138257 [Mycena rosella]|uniref:Uncharacterized protein n=1 Tax=Mycena rosella TaxID=1033263 RepID=A0AAD7D6L4_MYCRO|nr:hypothetical protein B0H17DRAFT_1138257 [Mycena rosella]
MDIGKFGSECWESREMQVEDYTGSTVGETIEGMMWKEQDMVWWWGTKESWIVLPGSRRMKDTSQAESLLKLTWKHLLNKEMLSHDFKGEKAKTMVLFDPCLPSFDVQSVFRVEGQVYVGQGSEFMRQGSSL